jgi:hypothetical protein
VGEESAYRGVSRTRGRIELKFADGEKLAVSPSQWGRWLDNSDVQDTLLLRQLFDRLGALYALPSAVIMPAPHQEPPDGHREPPGMVRRARGKPVEPPERESSSPRLAPLAPYLEKQ